MDEWMRSIIKADVPEQYHDIIDAIGLAPFLDLVNSRGGTYLYIPKADAVLRKIRDDKIKAEYKGGNYKALAVKYDLTEITIRRIVESDKNRALDGQTSMFELQQENSV